MPSLLVATLSDDDRQHVGPLMLIPRVWVSTWFARALEGYEPNDAAFWDLVSPVALQSS